MLKKYITLATICNIYN